VAKAVAKVHVGLEAGTAEFTAGMKKAVGSVGELQKAMIVAQVAATAITGAISTVVGAVKDLANFSIDKVKEQFAGLDQAAKEADRLGTTTQSLLELRYAADLSGVSAEQMTTAVQKMTKTVGMAATGSKTAQDALGALGLTAEQLGSLPLSDQLGLIGDRLNGIRNPAQRMTAALNIFGKSGAGMINVLKGGSAGLTEMSERFGGLSSKITDLDTDILQEANDRVSDLKIAFDDIFKQLAIELAPIITVIAKDFTAWLSEGDKKAGLVSLAMDAISASLGFVLDSIAAVRIGWNKLLAEFGDEEAQKIADRLLEIQPSVKLKQDIDKVRAEFEAKRKELDSKMQGGVPIEVVEDAKANKEFDKQQDKIMGTFLDLQKRVNEFDLSPIEKEISRLQETMLELQKLGASDTQLNAFGDLINTLERLMTEAEKGKKIKKPKEIKAAIEAIKPAEIIQAAAIERGSVEEFRLIHDVQDKSVQVAKQQLKTLDKIEKNTAEGTTINVVKF